MMELDTEKILKVLEDCLVKEDCSECLSHRIVRTANCGAVKLEFIRLSIALIRTLIHENERLTILCASKDIAGSNAKEKLRAEIDETWVNAIQTMWDMLGERSAVSCEVNGLCVTMHTVEEVAKELLGRVKQCPTCSHFVSCETACGGKPCEMYEENKK